MTVNETQKFRRVGRHQLRTITVLPSLITLLNGLAGLAAMVFASRVVPVHADPFAAHRMTPFAAAGYFLLLAMIADMLDGRIARMSKSTSSFGGQLDSLCDMISFGAAPAFVVIKLLENKLATAGDSHLIDLVARFIWIAAVGYFSCAAIRLARFNVENVADESAHMSFIGLPTPAAAGVVVSLLIFQQEFLPQILATDTSAFRALDNILVYGLPVAMAFAGAMMVSRIRYPHIVNQYLKGKKPLAYLMISLLVVVLLIWFRAPAMVLGFCGFAISGVVRHVSLRFRAKQASDHPAQA